MSKPKVSVVLAVYNHEKYVGKTIESVIGQTYQDWEFIIIDDCSSDGSADVVRKYQDERIRFYPAKRNRGAVCTFNELLKKAQGEYIAFIGSDDIWHSGKLQEQVDFLEQNEKTAVCFTWAEFIDEEDRPYSSFQKECDCDIHIFMHENRTQGQCLRYFFDNDNYFCHPSAVIRSDVVREIGGFDPRFRQLHDYDYWMRVLQKYPVHIIQKTLVQYRRSSSENASISASNLQNVIRVLNEHQTIIVAMIKAMDREIFCEAFQDLLRKEIRDEAQLICEKYFVLLRWQKLGVNNRQAAVRFLDDCVDGRVLDCLDQEYQYSLNDYYKETGEAWQLYPLDFYKDYQNLESINKNLENANRNLQKSTEELQRVNKTQAREIGRLAREIQGMSRTLSWRITKPLREVKKLGVKKGK